MGVLGPTWVASGGASGDLWDSFWIALEDAGVVFGDLRASLWKLESEKGDLSGSNLGLVWGALGLVWGCFGASFATFGATWVAFGATWAAFGAPWATFGATWVAFEATGAVFGAT